MADIDNAAVVKEKLQWIGRLLNIKIDLQTGKTKQQVIRTIEQYIREEHEAKLPEVSRASHYS